MTTAEMAKYIGAVALYQPVPAMKFPVEILDARMSWGKFQLQVKPVGGIGDAWVLESSLLEILID
jgi:hypothetical protein